MEYRAHEYQLAAINFEETHADCLLALDMGLGKTSITLKAICDLLDDFAVNRVLIIAPKFVAQDVWIREAKKWDFAGRLRIHVAVGTQRQRREAIDRRSEIVCINCENVSWLVDNYGGRWPFDMIVIDESSRFKSYSSKRFKSLRKILPKCSRIVELTGTPRPRSIEDLWPQIYLLDGGRRLGKNMTLFRGTFERPGRRNGLQVWEWLPNDGAEQEIYRRIGDISLSMTADDWLQVPDQVDVQHFVKLDPPMMKTYQAFARDSLLQLSDGGMIDGVNAGVLTGKLLQFANGAIYTDPESKNYKELHDSKLEALQEILDSTEDPVIVFYNFKSDRERLLAYLSKREPRELKNQQDITDWNAGKIRILLAQPASMGHGLNLQDGGNTIVWFGLNWNLEITQQANARLHRQGQKEKVFVHYLITQDTVDEDVMASLAKKDKGQQGLIEAIKARITGEGESV